MHRFFGTVLAGACVLSGCALLPSASCAFAADEEVEAILGEAELETFAVESLDECVFTSVDAPDQSIEVRVETVQDTQIFVEHAVEATSPDRVQFLDIGEGSVLFEGEGVLGRTGNQVILITGTPPADALVPLLQTSLSLIEGAAAEA